MMNTLTLQTLTFPAADLGPENPLAPLRAYDTASAAGIGGGSGDYPDAGREGSILPYRLQDQYHRLRRPRDFKTLVLESDHLRATFLPELGGRLWSLFDKRRGRELLFVNPVFQPANLAVRDAWFSGGVEWNVSIIGHSPFTCSPLFAARAQAADGSPMARLYEWDRIRRVPFQIDCWLSSEAPILFVRVRLINPHAHAVPMYWWSNIAVSERRGTRVLGPADQAYRHDYDGTLLGHDVPIDRGVDVTYTTNRPSAADLYFRIPQGQRPWIAAVDRAGFGLAHTSTDRLRGRKMFNWGMDPGGRRWQEFLAEPGCAYIEIQGGLAETQGEYLTMPAGAEWTWLEAYLPVQTDAARVHAADWHAARDAVEGALESALSRDRMNDLLASSASAADHPPIEILHHGSGWGALECRRRERCGLPPMAPASLVFPDETIGEAQRPWAMLLEDRSLPRIAPSTDPGSLMVQPEWHTMLEQSVRHEPDRENWLAWYHLGVMRFRAGDPDGARAAYERSIGVEPSAWAWRDLAVLAREAGNAADAAELWLRASRLAPALAPLAIECGSALLAAERTADLLAFIAALPPRLQSHGRIRLLAARASLATGDLDAVERYFEQDPDLATVREKETALSDLWFALQEMRLARQRRVPIDDALRREVRQHVPPPERFDFRLNAEQS